MCPFNQVTKRKMKLTIDRQNAKQRTAYNTYKKLAIQWLNQALCFISSSLVVDSFVLRKRQLLVAAKRSMPFLTTSPT